jgi:pyruvate formate lyase activating enzyme
MGIWVEVTTLIVPNQNDSTEELTQLAEFIVEVDPAIPWHVSRFHPDYQYLDSEQTPLESLRRAKKIGEQAGIRYVYMGNVLEGNNTYCYSCHQILIERVGYYISRYTIDEGKCPECGYAVDGVFSGM